MNFYQRRLGTLSKKHFQLVQKLNSVPSQFIDAVSERYTPPDFFVKKQKQELDKKVLDKVKEVCKCSEKHARQIVLVEGEAKLKKEMGI